jgi:hypothetical protein
VVDKLTTPWTWFGGLDRRSSRSSCPCTAVEDFALRIRHRGEAGPTGCRIGDRYVCNSVVARGANFGEPLNAALAEATGDPPFVNSDWERDLLDFCEDHDIPKPELNVLVEGFLVDALWRDLMLIVELDSWSHHRSHRAFEEDRRRDAVLQLAGYRVLRITKLDDYAAELLSAAVAAR